MIKIIFHTTKIKKIGDYSIFFYLCGVLLLLNR